jgi:hypothetical protein
MASEILKPPFGVEGAKAKGLNAQGKAAVATRVAIVLPDDALSNLGYHAGLWVEVALGDIFQGDLVAVLLTGGGWLVGFAFLNNATLLLYSGARACPPLRIPLPAIRTGGRVVSLGGRAVLQAGATLPTEGVDRIRIRFQL